MRFAFVATFAALVFAAGQAGAQAPKPAPGVVLNDAEILFFRRSEELRATAIAVVKSELKSLATSQLSRRERRERKLKLDQENKRLSDKKSMPVPAQLIEDVQPGQIGAIPAFHVVEGAIGDAQLSISHRRRVWRSFVPDAGGATGTFSPSGASRLGRGGEAVLMPETEQVYGTVAGLPAADCEKLDDESWTKRIFKIVRVEPDGAVAYEAIAEVELQEKLAAYQKLPAKAKAKPKDERPWQNISGAVHP